MGPSWKFKGRIYKTVSGLSKAIFADSGCDSHTMVDQVDRTITATAGRNPRITVARYQVSEPKIGEPMTVTRIVEASK